MRHVIKIGDLYLTPNGTFSTSQIDALRIDRSGDCRIVRLRPHGSLQNGDGDGNGQNTPPAGQ